MILILSHDFIDEPTNVVIDWLSYYKADFIRLNGDDYSFNKKFKIDINNNEIIDNHERKISEKDVNVVWYRRWKNPSSPKTNFEKYSKLNFTDAEVFAIEKYHKYLKHEESKLNAGIFTIFRNRFWIPKLTNARGNINKLEVLLKAKDYGLNIPNTIVTSNKKDVIDFLEINKKIITKPISEAIVMTYKDIKIPLFTKEVSSNDIDKFPDTFFPSLFQKNIEKEFEIRTFIYQNKVYSMAMFTQSDRQTSTDFRNYNNQKPNRYVPFLLPKEIEKKLLKLLKYLELNTGSIDLIYDNDGNYVFLEINPVGQFGMVSKGCNYHIEKMVAEDLIKLNDTKKNNT